MDDLRDPGDAIDATGPDGAPSRRTPTSVILGGAAMFTNLPRATRVLPIHSHHVSADRRGYLVSEHDREPE
jgi:hypothetical protein